MNTIKYLFFFSLVFFAFSSCEKDDITDDPQYDQSLILSRGSGDKLVLTNPVDGKDLFVSIPDPTVENVNSLKAGYMCKNAVFVAKTYLRDYTMSIYTCNAKTGTGTKAISPDNLFVYQDLSVSPVEAKIVFTAKPYDDPQYKSIYTINEDGSGLTHISQALENINGPNGGSYELQPIDYPAFSPDGTKISAAALARKLPSQWDYYEFILEMNSDGSSKEVIYFEEGQDIEYYDICWTQNGDFILFIRMTENDDNFHRMVKVLNLSNGNISDITSALEINGDQVNHISTSPNTNRIVFNQHLGGGSDLYIAEYQINNGILSVNGTPVKLTDMESSNYSYYTPSWQVWDEDTSEQ